MGWRLFPPAAGAKLPSKWHTLFYVLSGYGIPFLVSPKTRVKNSPPGCAWLRKFPAELTSLSAIGLQGIKDWIITR